MVVSMATSRRPLEQPAPAGVRAAPSSVGEGRRGAPPRLLGAPGTPRPKPSPKHRMRASLPGEHSGLARCLPWAEFNPQAPAGSYRPPCPAPRFQPGPLLSDPPFIPLLPIFKRTTSRLIGTGVLPLSPSITWSMTRALRSLLPRPSSVSDGDSLVPSLLPEDATKHGEGTSWDQQRSHLKPDPAVSALSQHRLYGNDVRGSEKKPTHKYVRVWKPCNLCCEERLQPICPSQSTKEFRVTCAPPPHLPWPPA